jgi:hypothetical protein
MELYKKGLRIMTFDEFVTELNLTDEQKEVAKKFTQSTEDRVRTTYANKTKELESRLKEVEPKELSKEQKTIQQLQNELAKEKFNNQLRSLGVSDEEAQFLNPNIDLEKFKDFYSAHKVTETKDFIPQGNQNEGAGITKEQFAKMNYSEKAKLYQENAELYNQLAN